MTATLLILTAPDAGWMRQAACQDMWSLMEGDSDQDVRHAKELCFFSCPVERECGKWVLSLPPRQDVYGVAAGMTAKERESTRRRIRRRRVPQVEPEPDKKCNCCGEVKPPSGFYLRPRDLSGREAQCIACRRKQNREYKAAKRAREAMA